MILLPNEFTNIFHILKHSLKPGENKKSLSVSLKGF